MRAGLLLDTHTFLWAVRAPELLSARAREAIESRSNRRLVPALVAWELAIKFRLGKLPEAAPLLRDFAGALRRLHAVAQDHTPEHMLLAGALDWPHHDPFDRLLASTALVEGLVVVSRDARFDEIPDLNRLW